MTDKELKKVIHQNIIDTFLDVRSVDKLVQHLLSNDLIDIAKFRGILIIKEYNRLVKTERMQPAQAKSEVAEMFCIAEKSVEYHIYRKAS